jgi:hypothetical protein
MWISELEMMQYVFSSDLQMLFWMYGWWLCIILSLSFWEFAMKGISNQYYLEHEKGLLVIGKWNVYLIRKKSLQKYSEEYEPAWFSWFRIMRGVFLVFLRDR